MARAWALHLIGLAVFAAVCWGLYETHLLIEHPRFGMTGAEWREFRQSRPFGDALTPPDIIRTIREFQLLIEVCGAFLALTVLNWLWGKTLGRLFPAE